MVGNEPYLSVVVTSRNDDHGGGPLRRMQIMVSGLVEQCRRHRLSAELIVVEWNPPSDRPRLKDALDWPRSEYCPVRIVEVSPERHASLRFSDVLPLFQMIAKNVGIRRARGRFVLATNIDILFSNELMGLLAARGLREDRMYRIDRHDVVAEVPVGASLDEQLEFCRTHLLRLHAVEGSFRLTSVGERVLESPDVADGASGIRFGRGFYPVEVHRAPLRGVTAAGELLVEGAAQERVLALDLQPGRNRGGDLRVSLLDQEGRRLATGTLSDRRRLLARIPPQPGERARLVLSSEGAVSPYFRSPRLEMVRVQRCAWASAADFERARPLAGSDGFRERYSPPMLGWLVPSRPLRRMLQRWFWWAVAKVRGRPPEVTVPQSPAPLHTNGCGDFTLLAREKWFELRGYPEFQLFSFHIDSVFCYSAHHGGAVEEVLPEPMRIYHVEHGVGSGWTPEGQRELFRRLEARGLPYLDHSVVMDWASQMRALDRPFVFNGEDWGLAREPLGEESVS